MELQHLTFDRSEPFLNGRPIDDLNFASLWRFKLEDFAALSHAWFEPLLVEKAIFINSHPLVVTGNLHAAILRLRNRLTTGLKVWVDAICINQEDLTERNLQVKPMGSIYRQALNTIVWPGDELIGIWKAFRFLRTLEIAHQQGPELAKSIISEESKRQDVDIWATLFSLFDRQYWKRLWVIQEIAAHTSTQIILCGQQEIRANLFYSASRAILESAEQVKEYLRLGLGPEHLFWVMTMKRAVIIYGVVTFFEATAPTLGLDSNFEIVAPLMLSLSKSAQQSEMRE